MSLYTAGLSCDATSHTLYCGGASDLAHALPAVIEGLPKIAVSQPTHKPRGTPNLWPQQQDCSAPTTAFLVSTQRLMTLKGVETTHIERGSDRHSLCEVLDTRRCPPHWGVAIKAEFVCRLALPGVCTGGGFGGKSSALLIHSRWGKAFLVGANGAIVPRLAGAASASWSPSHASAGRASHKGFPQTVKCGLLRGVWRRARGFRITKCYPSVVAAPGGWGAGVGCTNTGHWRSETLAVLQAVGSLTLSLQTPAPGPGDVGIGEAHEAETLR